MNAKQSWSFVSLSQRQHGAEHVGYRCSIDRAREIGNGRILEQGAYWQLNRVSGGKFRNHVDRGERVSSQGEKIVMNRYLIEAERFFPEFG